MTERHGVVEGSWLFLLLLGLLIWLPIPYGSNSPWWVATMGVAVGVLLALWALSALSGRVRIPPALAENRWIILLWLLWLGWIGCQLAPISGVTLAEYSPAAARAYALAQLGQAPPTSRISIHPELTYQHLLESISYFGLYLLVLVLVSGRDRLAMLAGALVLSGVLQAIYGSIMVLSGLEYGFLQKKTAYLGFATGTFINRNHLAGYLEICAAIGIGLVVADMRAGGRGGWRIWLQDTIELLFSRKLRVRVFVAMMVIALVLTRSRGGNTAFFVALAVCGTLYLLLRERKLFLKGALLFLSFLAVDLLIVSNWFGLEKVVERVERTEVATEGRAQILPELINTFEVYRTTGSGLGTFATAVLPFRVVDPRLYYDHAHNDYAQFLIETGVVGAAILALLVLSTMVHAVRVIATRHDRLRTGLVFGGLTAMTSLAIHSAVDFNLQIPANAATLVVVMAMINSCSHRSARKGPTAGREIA